eukprot:m.62625 g.62625  ORF g.62625 m.62625 type:complete len:575 (+) comp15810_c0_seq8:363-2087(+)
MTMSSGKSPPPPGADSWGCCQDSAIVFLMTMSIACTTIAISTSQWMSVPNAMDGDIDRSGIGFGMSSRAVFGLDRYCVQVPVRHFSNALHYACFKYTEEITIKQQPTTVPVPTIASAHGRQSPTFVNGTGCDYFDDACTTTEAIRKLGVGAIVFGTLAIVAAQLPRPRLVRFLLALTVLSNAVGVGVWLSFQSKFSKSAESGFSFALFATGLPCSALALVLSVFYARQHRCSKGIASCCHGNASVHVEDSIAGPLCDPIADRPHETDAEVTAPVTSGGPESSSAVGSAKVARPIVMAGLLLTWILLLAALCGGEWTHTGDLGPVGALCLQGSCAATFGLWTYCVYSVLAPLVYEDMARICLSYSELVSLSGRSDELTGNHRFAEQDLEPKRKTCIFIAITTVAIAILATVAVASRRRCVLVALCMATAGGIATMAIWISFQDSVSAGSPQTAEYDTDGWLCVGSWLVGAATVLFLLLDRSHELRTAEENALGADPQHIDAGHGHGATSAGEHETDGGGAVCIPPQQTTAAETWSERSEDCLSTRTTAIQMEDITTQEQHDALRMQPYPSNTVML